MSRSFAWSRALAVLAILATACSSGEDEKSVAPQQSAAPAASAEPAPTATRDFAHPEIKAELLADLEAPRHASDGGGRAWIEDAENGGRPQVRASSRARFPIVYEAGPLGIADGGTLFLQVSPFWGWDTPQTQDPDAPGYTNVTTDAKGITLVPRTLGQQLLGIGIKGRALREGEKVRIDFGAGQAGAKVDRFAETDSRFWIAVDGDGDGVRKLILSSPGADVHAGRAAVLYISLPGTAKPDTEVPLTVALLDATGNAAPPFAGEVRLQVEGDAQGIEVPASITLAAEDQGRKTVRIKVRKDGLYRVRGEATPEGAEGGTLRSESNPMLVDAKQSASLLWGDLQGHTQLSDGSASPSEYFAYGRDVAGLDFLAITDHDHWGLEALDRHPELWAGTKRQVAGFHEPGRFVALLGYEWTNWVQGHRHVVWFADEDEATVLSSLDPESDTPDELWAGLRGKPVLTFAHHSAGGPVPIDWSYAPDPELEPTTEISSVHGSSEAPDSPMPIYNAKPGNYVRDALDLGYVMGFVGGSDGHDGHPGLAQIAGGKSGVAAVWVDAPEPRTREALHHAIKTRRAYATNGPRILVQAALDGHPMGSVIPPAAPDAKPQRLSWRIAGTAPIERIDVIRRGKPMLSAEGEGGREWSADVEIPPLQDGEYVYLRVVQKDGGAAWTSPFFARSAAAAATGSAPQPAISPSSRAESERSSSK